MKKQKYSYEILDMKDYPIDAEGGTGEAGSLERAIRVCLSYVQGGGRYATIYKRGKPVLYLGDVKDTKYTVKMYANAVTMTGAW